MCNPLAIIGTALSVGGSMIRAQQQQAYINAVNAANQRAFQMSQKAREAERLRQREFETEQIETFDQTTETLSRENFDQERTDNATEFMNQLDARPMVLTEATALPGQNSTSAAIVTDRAKQAAKAAADARARIKALSDLTAYGTTGQGRAVAFGDASNDMATVAGLRRGSLTVGNQEQQIPAATVTPGSTAFADILSGVGGMVAMNGGGGMGLGLGGPSGLPTPAPININSLY